MITIIQGEDKKFAISLNLEDGSPYDLSNVTEAKVCMKNTDGTSLELTISGGSISFVDNNPLKGKLLISIDDSESSLLKKGKNLDLETELLDGGDINIIQHIKSLNVLARIC